MLLVIAYDIVDDSQRQKLATLLADYGQRVNYSVFECDLTPQMFSRLLTILPTFVRQKSDRSRIYRLCGHCEEKTTAFGRLPDTKTAEIIVI